MNKNKAWLLATRLIPRKLVSKGVKAIFESEHPVIKEFAKAAVFHSGKVDLTDAIEKNYHSYKSAADLFRRPIDLTLRPIDRSPDIVTSPVDGTVTSFGDISKGTIMSVKGKGYTVAQLLGSESEASRYENGSFMVLWLQVGDYHHIHSPADGRIKSSSVIPGELIPVLPEAVEDTPDLFARNERLITNISTDNGYVSVVKVGAAFAGGIEAYYDKDIVTDGNAPLRTDKRYTRGLMVSKGYKMGGFKFGSTVVLLTENKASFLTKKGAPIKMGEAIMSSKKK